MSYSFEYIDIILLAMIAGFIFLRLRGILGKRTGFEGKAPPQFQEVLKNVKDMEAMFKYATSFNQSLERAGRVADFLEFAELMCKDALERDESCGCHLREEHVHEDGEAKRDDEQYSHVAAWEWKGVEAEHELHKEVLNHDALKPTTRSYK